MKRPRFSRNCLASSRGAYVRKSHIALIQEHLKGTYTYKEVIEAQISISKPKTFWIKCFKKEIQISQEEAATLKTITNIIIK